MRITADKKQLVEALNTVGRIVSTKNLVPITQNVKITVRTDGMLVVSATDMEMSAMRKFRIAEAFDTQFEFCINPKDFAGAIKSLRDTEVTFDVDERSCVISHTKGELTLPIVDSEAFPVTEQEKDTSKVVMNAEDLFGWIKNGMAFTSKDELRPVMGGVHLYIRNGEVGVCATDGRALFHDHANNNEYVGVDVCATIPSKAIPVLLDLINGEEKVIVYFGQKRISFRTDTTMLSCVTPEGNYPNFKSLFRDSSPIKVTIGKEDLIESISRVGLFASSTTSLIRLKADNGTMSIDSEDIDLAKKGHEVIDCTVEGEGIEIGVNGAQFLECLRAVDAVEVRIEFVRPDMAINIYDSSYPHKLLLAMPMHIR